MKQKQKRKRSISPAMQSVPSENQEDGQSELEDSDSSSDRTIERTDSPLVTPEQFKAYLKLKSCRLCCDLTKICDHIDSIQRIKCAKKCEVCGVDAYTTCNKCPGRPGLQFYPIKGEGKGKSCFMEFHSDGFFGLAKSDSKLFEGKKNVEKNNQPTNQLKK